MKSFSISECYSQAWHLLTSNIVLFALFFICSIPELMSGGFSRGFMGTGSLNDADINELYSMIVDQFMGVGLVMYIVQLVLQVGFFNGVMNVVKGGKADFSAYKASGETYVKWICADFLVSLICGIGFAICIIPGIFLSIKLMFVPYILLDDPQCGFTEAFQRSWSMTKGNIWNMFGLLLSVIGVVFVGVLCCCIGIYFAVPLAALAIALAYQELKPEEEVIIEEA